MDTRQIYRLNVLSQQKVKLDEEIELQLANHQKSEMC